MEAARRWRGGVNRTDMLIDKEDLLWTSEEGILTPAPADQVWGPLKRPKRHAPHGHRPCGRRLRSLIIAAGIYYFGYYLDIEAALMGVNPGEVQRLLPPRRTGLILVRCPRPRPLI
jgi:hypothetical protein